MQPPTSEATYQYAKILRFLKFFISNILAVVVPLAIFNLTHDLTITGFAVILEWVPKVSLYLTLGQFFKVYGEANVKLATYTLKTIAIALGCLSIAKVIDWHWLLLVTPFNQLNLAVISVLYEVNAKKWSNAKEGVGHAYFLKLDNLSGIFALIICVFIKDEMSLMALCFVLCCIAVTLTIKSKPLLFEVPHTDNFIKIKSTVYQIIKQFNEFDTKLVLVTLIDVVLSVPIAILFTAYPFFIAHALSVQNVEASLYSSINLTRVIACYAFLHFCTNQIAKKGSFVVFSACMVFCIVFAISMPLLHQYLFIGVTVLFGAVSYGCYPWIRATRQVLMTNKDKHALTALINAFKGLSFVAAGLLMLLNISPVLLFSGSVIATSFITLLLLLRLRKLGHCV